MIKKLTDISLYMDFIQRINSDSSFSDPMLLTDEQIKTNLINAAKSNDTIVLGVFNSDKIIGLFVFLISEEENYGEMLVGLSDDKIAYDELFIFLEQNYKGINFDFVYNPNNDLLSKKLTDYNASFEIEQQKLILKTPNIIKRKHNIIEYKQEYKDSYLSIHEKDTYWTAGRLIKAFDRFRVILCIVGEKVAGYLDITHSFRENEPYDLFVLKEYRNRGIASEMLSLAIELNKDNTISVLVDITNLVAIHLYEKMGFVRAKGNNITAHLSFC